MSGALDRSINTVKPSLVDPDNSKTFSLTLQPYLLLLSFRSINDGSFLPFQFPQLHWTPRTQADSETTFRKGTPESDHSGHSRDCLRDPSAADYEAHPPPRRSATRTYPFAPLSVMLPLSPEHWKREDLSYDIRPPFDDTAISDRIDGLLPLVLHFRYSMQCHA